MPETFTELVDITNAGGGITIQLDGNTATVSIGGSSTGGVLVVNAPAGPALRFDALGAILRLGAAGNAADLSIRDASDRETLAFQAGTALLRIGIEGNGGDIDVQDSAGRQIFHVASANAVVRIGNSGNAGDFVVHDANGREALQFEGGNAVLRIGNRDNEGDLIVRDNENREVFHFDGGNAVLRIGTAGNEGDISVRDGRDREVFQFDSEFAVLRIGAAGNEGDLIVRDNENREVFHFDGGNAVLRIGTTGNEGDISVRDASNREVFQFDSQFAVLRVGAAGNEGDIICRDDAGNESIHLNGGAGDIILRNADVAEQFDIADAVEAPPGTVMALAGDGTLAPTASAYDRTVVGVVAGGGRYRSGIVMDHREPGAGRRVPIAMVGKAACRVDARHGPVRVGDLLTSSPTPGCAMRAQDPAQAFGAVIGKALTPLDEGTGLVEMIISLQ
jgi:hypothetical protein